MFRTRLLITALLLGLIVSCSIKHAPHVAKLDIKEKDDVYYRFIVADLLAMKGEAGKSTSELLKLAERYPKMAFFHYLLAQNYGRERNFKGAIEASKRAVELAPDFMEARIYLGKLYASEERHQDAIGVFADIIHDSPKKEEVYPFLAGEYAATRDYNRAIETLRAMLAVNPDAVVAYYYLGAIYGEHLKRPQDALRMYREALAIDPGNVSVHNAIGEVYLRGKQLKKALAKYREILHLEPDEMAVALRIALIHYELGEFDQAIAIFEDILAKNPEADKIRFYLGVLYEGTKEPQKAIAELMKVPPNSSFFKDAILHIASLNRAAGASDAAVGVLRDAIAKKGQVSEFYEYLAALLEEAKEYRAAIAALEEGHAALPEKEKIAFLLAIMYEKVEDRDRAIAAMRSVLKINPQNASALNYIGYTYAERSENLDEALELIQQALVLRPDDGYMTDSLGWVYFKQGDIERALKYLMKANTSVPGEPTILYHVGEALFKKGDPKGALKFFERALDAGSKRQEPDEKEMGRIRERIEELK